MSILDALKQQTSSIDDLAKLPQAMIMQMAQKGQIRQDMVMPILSRKAELTQAAVNTRAMQNAPAQQSVMEQLMAQNAEAEMQPRDMGVAQLPIREDMYDEQRMAGGGIVAFQDNEDQPVDENMPATDDTNPYLARSRAVAGFGRSLGQAFMDPRNYNPLSVYQRAIGQPFAAAANRFMNEPLGQQADRFRRASQARENIGRPTAPTTPAEVKKLMPAAPIQGDEASLFAAERIAKENKLRSAPTLDAAGNVVPAANAPKAKQVAAVGANVVADQTGTSPVSVYEQMLLKQGEDAKKAQTESKYLRMLEAGLGIMGGTSQYAFANIGQGAMGAAKGYAEDIKGFRAEERERAKLLGSLAMEKEKIAADREKTAMLERRYKEMTDVDRQKIALMATQNKDEKTARLVNQAFNTLMSEYKTRLDRGDVTAADLYMQAQQMVASSLGTNVGGAPAAPANPTVSWSSLNAPKGK